MRQEPANLIELLQRRSAEHGDQVLFRHLSDDNDNVVEISYAELEQRALAVASYLQERFPRGERVLILSPCDLESIVGFFGCVVAGMVAVPAPPPRPLRPCSRIKSVIEDARPAIVLAPSSVCRTASDRFATNAELMALPWANIGEVGSGPTDLWKNPGSDANTLAFLQYTSGSTAAPKGVMVSHGNLLANSATIYDGFENHPGLNSVMWLPFYHDMGLIGGVLQVLYSTGTNTFISPASFLQRPLRWLSLISKLRSTIAGAPCFAYELLVRKTTPEQRAQLDLSSWTLAFTGAEAVHADTLQRFTEAFAPSGFRPHAFYPCYGLAEATLMVSGGKRFVRPILLSLEAEALRRRHVRPVAPETANARVLVGCGQNVPGQTLAIVDPRTRVRVAPDQIGEIWVAGPSVAEGYWNNPEATEIAFRARLADTGEGPFLRTGDLGFIHDEELYIVGRLKDVINIHGRNYYPTDIERSVEACHPLIRPGSSAAFAVEEDGWEQIAVAVEVERQYREADADDVIVAVRQTIADQHEVDVAVIMLLKPGTLPRTTSGKIQRGKAREEYVANEFKPLVCWKTATPLEALPLADEPSFEENEPAAELVAAPTAEAIRAWLIDRIATRMGILPRNLDVNAPLVTLGLSSKEAVLLTDQLEKWLKRPVPATLIYNYPTIELAVAFLAGSKTASSHGPAREPSRSDLPDVTRFSEKELEDYVLREVAHLQALAKNDDRAPNGTDFQPNLSPLQKAALALTEARRRNEAFWQAENEPIAVVGMGCRFPGGIESPEAFWRMLAAGADAIEEVPPERWDVELFYDPEPGKLGKANTRWGGWVKDADKFEPEFFGISPREASFIDPQQRLLLEVAWEALEDAGLPPTSLAGSNTGVFVGAISVDWIFLIGNDPESITAQFGPGAAHSILANRISYIFDFHGPSLALDTACSSSLVTVHLACKALRRRETDVALAGGVNLILSPGVTIALSQARMMSSTGRCKTFDASADGYVRGEGCGLVVLKRLSDAVANGDRILGIIRGTATNQDGRSNGLVAPSGPAQEAVIREALAEARVEPNQIDYVEAHGTGTALGDPIEVQALLSTLGSDRDSSNPLLVGSVKTNIGHLESAAGIAGFIKTILALNHGKIPPHLHLKTLNPHLRVEGAPIAFPLQTQPWPEGRGPRYAGVSSFGFGGSNAHVVLEGPPAPIESRGDQNERPRHLLTLSARTPAGLQEMAKRYADHLEAHPELSFADVAWSANSGRSPFNHRLALSAVTSAEAREHLRTFASGIESPLIQSGEAAAKTSPAIVFLLTGQGSQYVGMGQALYQSQPVFREALDRCDEWLRPILDRPLLSVLYPKEGESSPLDQTQYTQPALFALEYALIEMWGSWGVKPTAILGHSVGEYAAACAAGVFSPQEGIRLIAERGRLMQALPSGGVMQAVFASEERVRAALEAFDGLVSVAAINGPANTVISGPEPLVEQVLADLSAEGIRSQRLVTSHAFHSHLLDPMLGDLERAAASMRFARPRFELVSNLTGEPVTDGMLADPAYWRNHARNPVQFYRGVRHLAESGNALFLEIGPHPTLLGMARRCLSNDAGKWLPSLRRNVDDWQSILDSLATLYVSGVNVDWAAFDRGYSRRRVALPTYPFQRQSYWVGEIGFVPGITTQRSDSPVSGPVLHPILGRRIEAPIAERIFENTIAANRPPVLGDHRVHGVTVVPCAIFLETALAAAANMEDGPWSIDGFTLIEPLALAGKAEQVLQTIVSPEGSDRRSFRIVTRRNGEAGRESTWTTHATGSFHAVSNLVERNGYSFDATSLIARISGEPFDAKCHARAMQAAELELGPSYRWIETQWAKNGEASRGCGLRARSDQVEQFRIHPGLLECCILLLETTRPGFATALGVHVLASAGTIKVHGQPTAGCWAHVVSQNVDADGITGKIHVYDDAGHVLIELKDVRLRRVPRDWLARLAAGSPPKWLYELAWQANPLESVGRWNRPAGGRWLVVSDRRGIGAEIAARLETAGASCLLVCPNDPGLRQTVSEWVTASAIGHVEGLIYAAALDLQSPSTVDGFEPLLELSCGKVLDILHGLTDVQVTKLPRLWLVTQGAQATGNDEPTIDVSASPLWGLGRVIAVEMPELDCVRIDLDPNPSAADAAAVWQEIVSNGRETQVAHRGDARLVARLRRLVESDGGAVSIRSDCTYLITGGLGGLGLKLAQWLVNRGARHLALTGRRGASGEALEILRQLESDGAQVLIVQADVGRQEDVVHLLERIDAELPALGGVFHAAGVLDDGTLRQQSRSRFRTVMGAKVEGAWHLHTLTRDRPLDLFVMFSSAASLLGSPGQGNYAAANAFLDALAHHRRKSGLPALAINWGGWAEVGMAAELDRREGKRRDAAGIGRIDPVHGLMSMEQLLGGERAEVGVLPIDWSEFFEQFPKGTEPAWLAEMAQHQDRGSDGPPELVKQLEETAPAERRAAVLAYVRKRAAQVLRLGGERLPDPRRTLNELGVDSLMGVELCNVLGRGVGKHLAPTILFTYPTLAALADHLADDILGLAQAEEPVETPASANESRELALSAIEQLTEEEINALIVGEFSKSL